MCWFCGSPIPYPEPIGRSLICVQCGKDLRICRHCRHFVAGSRGACRESQAELVLDKEKSNFCDWFSLNPVFREKTSGESRAKQESALRDFNNLFGNQE